MPPADRESGDACVSSEVFYVPHDQGPALFNRVLHCHVGDAMLCPVWSKRAGNYPGLRRRRPPEHQRHPPQQGHAGTLNSKSNNCGPFSQPAIGQEGNEKINGFRNPGFAQTDLTLEKITKIDERVDFRLRVDAFNALNRVNLNAISSNANDGNFGRATSTSTPRFLLLGARINF